MTGPGLRRHRSHDIEPIDACLIAHAEVENVGAEGMNWRHAAWVEVIASSGGTRPSWSPPSPAVRWPCPISTRAVAVFVDEGKGRTRVVHGRNHLASASASATSR